MAKANKPSLRKGRPPLVDDTKILAKQNANVNARRKSAKATRTLINKHHQLQKQRNVASISGDMSAVQAIDDELNRLGGLCAYQAASLTGQDKDRGGDSSVKLVEWLRKYRIIRPMSQSLDENGYRVLEVGALSHDNAISLAIGNGIEFVKRIDLHSQDPKTIEEVDFMDLPVPPTEREKFDILSLSLVLNYVPHASQRGAMLYRTVQFLRGVNKLTSNPHLGSVQSTTLTEKALPCLFVVLPLPCMENSRYMTHQHFIVIMRSLGYVLVEHHDSQKLCYMLLKLENSAPLEASAAVSFKKVELRSGKSRNNFAIVLDTG